MRNSIPKKDPLLSHSTTKVKEKKAKENEEVTLRKTIRWFILTLFFIIYLLLMLTVGIISSATKQIKEDLNLNNQDYGLLGTLNGAGKIIGTFLFMIIVNMVNRKYMTISTIVLNAVSIFAFTLTDNHYLLHTLRTLNGVFQVFGFLYFPIWIDQFGIQSKKTAMLTLIQLASPLGMVVGYTLNTIIGSKHWKIGFYIEAGGEIVLCLVILFIPHYYFSKRLFFKSHADGTERVQNKTSRIVSIFYVPPLEGQGQGKDSSDNKPESNFWKNVKLISSNGVFIFSVLYKSQNQFLCCGIGHWLTDYLENGLLITSSQIKLYSYITIIVGGPMIGLLFGGFIGHYTGGYEKKGALVILCVLNLISCLIGMFAPFADGILAYNIIMAVFFIFNSAVMPVLTGVILWSMPKHLKGLGNGIASLATNALGKSPAPAVYGTIQLHFNETIHQRIGMITLMGYNFVGFVFLVACSVFRFSTTQLKTGTEVFEIKKDQESKDRPSLSPEHIAQVFSTQMPNDAINEVNGNDNESDQYEVNEEEID